MHRRLGDTELHHRNAGVVSGKHERKETIAKIADAPSGTLFLVPIN